MEDLVINRFDDVKTVLTQQDGNWRQYITDSVNLIVKKLGRSFAEVRNETYDRLRSTTSCNFKNEIGTYEGANVPARNTKF